MIAAGAPIGPRERLAIQDELRPGAPVPAGIRDGIGDGIRDTIGARAPVLVQIMALRDVDQAGIDLPISWAPVAGATAAEVDQVTLPLGPAVRETALGALSASVADGIVTVEAPAGRRLRSLKLGGLANPAGPVGVAGRRLLVSLRGPDGGWQPSYAVPAMKVSSMGPTVYGGASYGGGVLRLPDVVAGRLRIAVASGDDAGGLATVPGTTIGTVTGIAADPPLDLALDVVGGAPVWSFAGEMPAGGGDLTIDATAAVAAALNARLSAGAAPAATLRLTAGRQSTVDLGALSVAGALVRAETVAIATPVEGAAVPLATPLPPPAAEMPSAVAAGLQWRYLGLRLLPEHSAPVPSPFAAAMGLAVGEAPMRRTLLPAVLGGQVPGRIALVGRALGPGRLTLTLLDAVGQPLAGPATADLVPTPALGAPWIDIADMAPASGAVTIEVRVDGGPFLWVADPEPQVRIAVRDPDPGGRPLLLDGAQLAAIDAVKGVRRDQHWPASAFRGRWPVLSSDLFLETEIFDLSLRYRR